MRSSRAGTSTRPPAKATPTWIRTAGGDAVRVDGVSREILPAPPAGAAAEFDDEKQTEQVSRSKLVALGRSLPSMFSPDSLPPIVDEVPSMALVRGAVVSLSQTPTPTPDEELSEEDRSTGLFESWDWDEAPPQPSSDLAAWDRLVAEVGRHRSPEPHVRREPVIVSKGVVDPLSGALPTDSGPLVDDEGSLDAEPAFDAPNLRDLAVSALADAERSGASGAIALEELAPTDAIESETSRAAPLPGEPRPVSDSVVDWPPPPTRPGIDYPSDWSRDEHGTIVVIDPHRVAVGDRSAGRVFMIDLSAWLLGFLAMFFTGLITTASAALVLFALSL